MYNRLKDSPGYHLLLQQTLMSHIMFVASALPQISAKEMLRLEPTYFQSSVNAVVINLLEVVTLQRKAAEEDEMNGEKDKAFEGVAEAAESALTAGLRVIPVERFIDAARLVIASKDETVSCSCVP